MKKSIVTSAVIDPLGIAPAKQLHRGPAGRYGNRLAAVIQVAADQIVVTYADPPYVSWSAPVDVATDCADLPFDTYMRADGTILLVYTETVTGYLVARTIDFVNGQWSPGTKSTVYDGGISQYPTITADDDGPLWVAWSRTAGAVKYLQVKSSTDGGLTWGSGSADAGSQLNAGASSVYARLVNAPDALHAVFTEAEWNISCSTRPKNSGVWEGAVLIAGGDVDGADFDAAISASGLLGVAYSRNGLQYREFNGSIWSAIQTLDSNPASSPQIIFQSEIPIISYLSEEVAGRGAMKYVTRTTGTFSTPIFLDPRAGTFNRVTLYDTSSGTYQEVTAAAASDTIGDVYHPSSGAVMGKTGDCLYLGMTDRFRILHATLATAGSGGTVGYSYWDGSAWRAFDPEDGAYAFDATDRALVLWADLQSMPGDWQQSVVDGARLFWIRAEVTGDFTVAPVGTRIDAVTPVTSLTVRR